MMKAKLRLISQGARTAVKRIRRRPYVAGSTAFAAALLSIGVLASGVGETYSADAAMAARSSDLDMTDVDSLLDARSPGARRYGWLTDSKPRRLVGPPTERVLSSVRPRIAVPSVPDQPASFAPPATIVGEPVGPAGVPETIGPDGFPTGPVGPGGTPSGPGFVPGGVPPAGGPPGGPPDGPTDNPPTTPPTNPPVEPPVVPVVPEPATWAMLVVGFAMLGTALRRRRSTLRPYEVR